MLGIEKMFIGKLLFYKSNLHIQGILENIMKTFQSKKIFIYLLAFLLLCNFLPSSAKSNFKPPVLNSSDLVLNGSVNAIAVDEMTGIVYVGGSFTKVGEAERNHLAAIKTDSTLLNWNPDIDGKVYNIGINGENIYVGGHLGGVDEELGAIGTDGTILDWHPIVNGSVAVLTVSSSTIYVGGDFTLFDETGRKVRSNFASFSIPEED